MLQLSLAKGNFSQTIIMQSVVVIPISISFIHCDSCTMFAAIVFDGQITLCSHSIDVYIYNTELCASRAPVMASLSSGPDRLCALGRGGVRTLSGIEYRDSSGIDLQSNTGEEYR